MAVAFAVAGIALGFLPALYGGQGGDPVQVGEQSETLTPSPEQQEIQQKQFKNTVANYVVFTGPYFSVLLGAVVGLVLGTRLPGERQERLAVASAGAGLGAVLFVVFSGYLAVQQIDVFEQSFRFAQQVSFDFGTGMKNGIFVAIPTAVAAAGAAYVGNELTE